MSFFKDLISLVFPIYHKTKQPKGVLGHYDSRPFDHCNFALIYAQEKLIEDGEDIKVFSRNYKNTTFVNVLVYDEANINLDKYKFEYYKQNLIDNGIEIQKNNIVIIVFQHRNDNTIALCKKFCNSSKTNFEQGLVYNPVEVEMDYYKPVPKFYKLYDHYCKDIYFDLAFIDDIKG